MIIVNYRTPLLTVDCLRSLRPEMLAHLGAQVVVVENASGDDSARVISTAIRNEGWGGWARVVESPVNGGFAYGNNVALRPALARGSGFDFFWLLNPDTTVRPGALDALLEFARAHPDAGIMGSAMEGADGAPWPYAFRFPTLWSELDAGMRLGVVSRLLRRWAILHPMNDQDAQVDWVIGASMMVRREVFELVGLMDEHYFLYFEETDFCLQARRAGCSCWYVARSRVMHIAGQSTGVTGKQTVLKRMPKYWFDSRRRYFIKNRSRTYAIATDLVWTAAHALWRVRRVIQRRPPVDPPHFLADFFRYSALATSDIDGNPTVTDGAGR